MWSSSPYAPLLLGLLLITGFVSHVQATADTAKLPASKTKTTPPVAGSIPEASSSESPTNSTTTKDVTTPAPTTHDVKATVCLVANAFPRKAMDSAVEYLELRNGSKIVNAANKDSYQVLTTFQEGRQCAFTEAFSGADGTKIISYFGTDDLPLFEMNFAVAHNRSNAADPKISGRRYSDMSGSIEGRIKSINIGLEQKELKTFDDSLAQFSFFDPNDKIANFKSHTCGENYTVTCHEFRARHIYIKTINPITFLRCITVNITAQMKELQKCMKSFYANSIGQVQKRVKSISNDITDTQYTIEYEEPIPGDKLFADENLTSITNSTAHAYPDIILPIIRYRIIFDDEVAYPAEHLDTTFNTTFIYAVACIICLIIAGLQRKFRTHMGNILM